MVLLWKAPVTLKFCWATREFTFVWMEIIMKSFQFGCRHLAGQFPLRPGLEKYELREFLEVSGKRMDGSNENQKGAGTVSASESNLSGGQERPGPRSWPVPWRILKPAP